MMPLSPYVHQQTAPRQVCTSASPHPSIGTVGSEHCSNTEEENGKRGHEGGPLGLAATQPQSSFSYATLSPTWELGS